MCIYSIYRVLTYSLLLFLICKSLWIIASAKSKVKNQNISFTQMKCEHLYLSLSDVDCSGDYVVVLPD